MAELREQKAAAERAETETAAKNKSCPIDHCQSVCGQQNCISLMVMKTRFVSSLMIHLSMTDKQFYVEYFPVLGRSSLSSDIGP